MQPPVELSPLRFLVEMQETNREKEGVDGKHHVHVDMHHGADQFTESLTQLPRIGRVVVDSERHGEQKKKVCDHQVQEGDGG